MDTPHAQGGGACCRLTQKRCFIICTLHLHSLPLSIIGKSAMPCEWGSFLPARWEPSTSLLPSQKGKRWRSDLKMSLDWHRVPKDCLVIHFPAFAVCHAAWRGRALEWVTLQLIKPFSPDNNGWSFTPCSRSPTKRQGGSVGFYPSGQGITATTDNGGPWYFIKNSLAVFDFRYKEGSCPLLFRS